MADEIKQDEIDQLLEGNQQEVPKESEQEGEKPQEDSAPEGEASSQEGSSSEEDLLAQWEEALKEAKEAEGQKEEGPSGTDVAAEKPKFEEFSTDKGGNGAHPSLDFILDIPLEISVEVGRSKMIINDLLKLTQGSIIELNKLAGEPAEIYVNQRLMARGEIVVVNDRFAVRLTEIISPQERVRQLGS